MGNQFKTKGVIYRKLLKRPLDIILSLFAIIVLSPLLLIIAVLVRLKLGGPVLFKQKRPGFGEKIFTMYKFRTMTDERNENDELLHDSLRLTGFGKILRETSLDELPELFNIIKGDMAIVGPRPQLVKDIVFMTSEQRERHTVRPGLTGWAQVNGRNNITWEEKLALDIEYVKRITLINDLKIIFMTTAKVFKKEDINTDGMDTAEDYGEYLLKLGKIDIDEYQKGIEESNMLLK